jgi:succinate dehydrogenase flavin-adding protein (antitoxin of CptAB toxin-antitoxin module)
MEKEEINILEDYIFKTNLEIYKLLMTLIKKNYNTLEVRDLGDYAAITQQLNDDMKQYLNQKKEQNKLKETFKNHKK